MLKIRAIEDRRGLQELAPVWDSLLESSGSNSIFLTWDWIDTWLEVYGTEFELLVLVADEGGEPRGVAPLMIRRGDSAVSRYVRSLMFIGQEVDVTPEYLDFIVPRGLEPAVTPLLVDRFTGPLADRWDFISFAQQLSSSPNRRHLASGLAKAGIELAVVGTEVAPYATLPSSFDAFLGMKSSGFRKQLKNKKNRLHRAGRVRYLLGGEDLPRAAALEEIIRLNRSRWQEAGQSFRTDRYREFHQRLVERLGPQGRVVLMLMELDGEVVAGRYDYLYDRKLWCYQGGWSPEHRDLNLGDNMISAVIEWGIDRGALEYDFLGGSAIYKERWSTGERRMEELRASNHTGRAQLLRLLRQGRDLFREDLPRAVDSLRAASRRLLTSNGRVAER